MIIILSCTRSCLLQGLNSVSHLRAVLICIAFLTGVSQAYEIYHVPPDELYQGVPSQLEVLTPYYLPDPQAVTLHLRLSRQQSYQNLAFNEVEGAWFCEIPVAYMETDTLFYYISASFGAAGLAAFPAIAPEENPVKIPLIKFNSLNRAISPKLIKDHLVDFKVTPWKKRPVHRSNNFPVLYLPKSNRAFIESGYIRIVGNEKASKEDLMRSVLYLCLEENADAVTDLKFSLLTEHPDRAQPKGYIEVVAVYLRRVPRD